MSVQAGQVYEYLDGRSVRVELVRPNGTALTRNVKSGRRGNLLVSSLEGSGWRLIEGVK